MAQKVCCVFLPFFIFNYVSVLVCSAIYFHSPLRDGPIPFTYQFIDL